MARKLVSLQRILGGEAIVGIIYGEISSSLYFALGIVALWALDLTPIVLLFAGILFALAASAYAEGATAFAEPGGAAGIARRAFGPAAGFIVGWAVLLDFAVVIALSLVFVPHYAVAAVGQLSSLGHPTDSVIAGVLAVGIGGVVLAGRPRLSSLAVPVAAIDLAVQAVLALLGLALIFDPSRLTRPLDLGSSPTWDALIFAIPIAMLAFTGIEIVANLLREAREAPRLLERSTIAAIVGAVISHGLVALAALSAFPVRPLAGTPSGHASAISTTWLDAPLAGVAEAVGREIAPGVGTALRAAVGISGILILLFSALSAYVGATRLVSALGAMGALPSAFTRRSRRSPVPLPTIALVAATVVGVLLVASFYADEASGLAAIYSFGILIAFMAVFGGITWLRFVEPGTARPLRMRLDMQIGRAAVPFTAIVGFGLSWLVWVLALGTHRAVRTVPPLWIAIGIVVYVATRRRSGRPLLRATGSVAMDVEAPTELAEVPYGTILVPMKQAGPIEEEMLATAAKLALAQGARLLALYVAEVPLADELDVELDGDDERVAACRTLAEQFARDYAVPVDFQARRGRAVSSGIAAAARDAGAGLILVGAVPHFGQRAGRATVFSETIENLLRRAHCRVIVTAFPPGTASIAADEDAEPVERGHG